MILLLSMILEYKSNESSSFYSVRIVHALYMESFLGASCARAVRHNNSDFILQEKMMIERN